MKTKYFFAMVKAINEQDRTIDAVASTAEIDRDNDIVIPSAFEASLGSFKANPVILACHQHRLSSGSSPVIGSAVPDKIKIQKTKVTFTMRFAETPLGEEYWKLYKDKHMRAFSIGFIPIEWTDEKDERAGYIRTYTKIELLEISAVPVPSNRTALARAKGYFEDSNVENKIEELVKTLNESIETQIRKQIDEFALRIEDSLDDIKTLIVPDPDGLSDTLAFEGVSVAADSAGQKEKLEQIMSSIKNLITKNAE